MIKINAYGEEFVCSKAVKGSDYIYLFNEDNKNIISFDGISSFDNYILLEGIWSNPEPTDKERISELETLVLQLTGII